MTRVYRIHTIYAAIYDAGKEASELEQVLQTQGLERFYTRGSKAGINPDHAVKLRQQLNTLALAIGPQDMAISGWFLHALHGSLEGYWSVRVSGNWRLTFRFEDGDAEVVDYHYKETLMDMFDPCHPGELIRAHMGKKITVTALANHLGITRAQMSMILNGRAGISPLMSLKLDEAFSKSHGFWSRAQQMYDLAQARRIKRPKVKPLVAVYKAPLDHAA